MNLFIVIEQLLHASFSLVGCSVPVEIRSVDDETPAVPALLTNEKLYCILPGKCVDIYGRKVAHPNLEPSRHGGESVGFPLFR